MELNVTACFDEQEGFIREEEDELEVQKLKDALMANVTRHGGT